jgi:hypothetical protein
MITHNGTYLGAATHHGMPIVAATMGGKMVIRPWLLSATLQAIVAAFGAEGTEVIRKTNDYLNRIATTDPQRALQISGFINEDPLLVCSLVETSKTRWLVGDGKAWIDTGIVPTLTTEVETTIKYDEPLSGSVYFWGVGTGGAETCFRQQSDKFLGFRAWYSAAFTVPITAEQGRGYDIVVHSHSGEQYIVIDGVKYAAGAATSANNSVTCLLYTMNFNGPYTSGMKKCSFGKFKITTESATAHFVPFRRNGQMELLDILTGTLATRVGTFTEQITPA